MSNIHQTWSLNFLYIIATEYVYTVLSVYLSSPSIKHILVKTKVNYREREEIRYFLILFFFKKSVTFWKRHKLHMHWQISIIKYIGISCTLQPRTIYFLRTKWEFTKLISISCRVEIILTFLSCERQTNELNSLIV